MNIFLVGGAVRDQLLGLEIKERDYVVTGATPEQMLSQGFVQVGKDFPVFLHPETHDEYALARQLRGQPGKVVTLEEDLSRRDLTINAMALRPDGTFVDPFGGYLDLQAKILRHVSPAFTEDPLRVLRVARFMARFAHLGFAVAEETLSLMAELASLGQLDALVPERVWQELVGALECDSPDAFFITLRQCGALVHIFPEIDRLWGVPQTPLWHPEIDCGLHTLLCLRQAVRLSPKPEVRFAALTHDLGKGVTPDTVLPAHHGHEGAGAWLVAQLCDRLKAPKTYRRLAYYSALHHGNCHRIVELRPSTVLKLLETLRAFQSPELLYDFLLVCEADYLGRTGFEQRPYPQADIIRRYYAAARDVDVSVLTDLPRDERYGEALHGLRLAAIKRVKQALSLDQLVVDPEAGEIGADGRAQGAEEEDQQGA